MSAPCPSAALRETAGMIGLLIGLSLSLPGCSANPVTGRREIVLMSAEEESELGSQASLQVATQIGLAQAPTLAPFIEELGQRLAAHSPRQDVSYSFQIVEMAEINAFALPGGYIYVSRGLLSISNSEDELANVIAHEIGHVAARHHAQQQTRATGVGILTLPGRLVGSILGGVAGALIEAPFQVLGTGIIAAYGRDQEREADRIAQRVAVSAGYDPAGLAHFLETLEKDTVLRQDGGERGPHFLDSHPSTPERVEAATRRGRELQWTRLPTIAGDRSAFLRKLDGLLVGVNSAEGLFRDELFLHPDLDFALHFPENWQTVNTHTAVGAVSPDARATVTLELQGRGSDPEAAAKPFFDEIARDTRVEVGQGESLEIGGLSAYRTAAAVSGSGGLVYLDLTWLAHRGNIYRVVGAASSRSFETHRMAFASAAASFRPLDPEQRSSIRDRRLRLERAKEGESLELLSLRTGNAWSLAETAVSNGIESGAALADEDLVKIAVEEPHASPEG